MTSAASKGADATERPAERPAHGLMSVVAALGIIFAIADAVAQDRTAIRGLRSLTPAHFVCGRASDGRQTGLASGVYETSVHLFNASHRSARFAKSFVRALPFQRPGDAASSIIGEIEPLETITVECDEIRHGLPAPMVEQLIAGFVLIRAEPSIVATTVYTARGGQLPAHDLERVPSRDLGRLPGAAGGDGLCGDLNDTAAVVEATVTDLRFTFDPAAGPREEAVFAVETVHLGEHVGSEIVLRTSRGPTPDGEFLDWSALPLYHEGGRFLIFLRNTAWFISPVVGLHAYHVVEIDGVEAVVDQEGLPVAENPGPNAFEAVEENQQPAGAVRRRVFDPRYRIDLQNPSAYHEPPDMVPGVDAGALDGAMSVDEFMGMIAEEARRCEAPFTPGFRQWPDPDRTWTIIATSPDPAGPPPVPACGATIPGTGEEVACE